MKNVLFIVMVLAASFAAQAQDAAEALDAARQERAEIVKRNRIERAARENPKGLIARKAPALAVTDEEVGDSDSFNKNARFFGIVAAGVVFIEADCDPLVIGDLGPDDRCIEVPDPAVLTDVTFNDIGRITFPAKKADNIIYAITNHSTSIFSRNGTAANVSGLVNYLPSFTIESVALNDPAAIDPATGLPMNGSYTTGGIGSKTSQKTLAPTFIELENLNFSRANTLGFSRAFWAALGLPQNVINEIYKKPMTIKLNMRVRARYVEFATFAYGVRFFAN